MASDNDGVRAKQNDEGAIADNLHLLEKLPRGWANLFLDMLAKLPPGTKLYDVGEKFGSLAVDGPPEHHAVYGRYEARSLETCSQCTREAHRRQRARGKYIVVCDKCAIEMGVEHPTSASAEDPLDLQEQLLEAVAGTETPDEVGARKAGVLDVEARRREKAAARAKDEADLKAGLITREELSRRNSMFAAFDLSKAKVHFPEKE